MRSLDPPQEDRPADCLLEMGSELLGGLGAAGLGVLVGGAPGALAGGATGPLILRAARLTLGEMADRTLSRREKMRVGAAYLAAQARIQELLDAGEQIRDDGFLDERGDGSSDAQEILEGVLLVAKRQYEERKVPYIGRLLANVAFDSKIDPALAHQLLRLADQLSYRQLCLLALIAKKDRFGLPDERLDPDRPIPWPVWGAWRDLHEIGYARLELVTGEPKDNRRPALPDNRPSRFILRPPGLLVHALMDLELIPEDDLEAVLALLCQGVHEPAQDRPASD